MTEMWVDDIGTASETLRKEITAQVVSGSQILNIWYLWKGEACPVPGDVIICSVLVPAMQSGRKIIFLNPLFNVGID